MTRFNIEQITDVPDRIYVEIDHRFNLAIVRTDSGIEIRVYPLTDGKIWDSPFTSFIADEAEFRDLETDLRQSSSKGDGQ